jgi:hypothetical protein
MSSISNSAIIVLCIVAAGVVVLVGWAMTHRMRSGGEDEDERAFYTAENGTGGGNAGASQFTYMREMRERYKEDIMTRFGPHRHHQQRPRQQSIPMSGAPTSGMGASDYSY